MSTIFIARNENQHETYDENQVREMLGQGLLTSEILFWKEGMAEWRPLADFPASAVPPKPPPPAKDAFQKKSAFSEAKPVQLRTAPALSRQHFEEDDMRYRFRFMHKERFLRLVAVLIDFVLIVLPIIFLWIIRAVHLAPESEDDPLHSALFIGLGLYFVALICSQVAYTVTGRSIGKNIFTLRAVDENSHAGIGFFRYLIRFLTHGAFALVPICIFTPVSFDVFLGVAIYAVIDGLPIFYEDRCLHDYLAGTAVLQRFFF